MIVGITMQQIGLRRSLVILVLFGVVFGYLEAAAVVYIRVIYEPIHHRLFPERESDDLFPPVLLRAVGSRRAGPPPESGPGGRSRTRDRRGSLTKDGHRLASASTDGTVRL